MMKAASNLVDMKKAYAVILVGDFNARHSHWGDKCSNEYGDILFDELDFSLFSVISSSEPTFVSSNGNSYIDFALVSNSLLKRKIQSKTDPFVNLFSGAPFRGHVPVILDYELKPKIVKSVVKEKIDICSIPWERWTQEMEYSCNWAICQVWDNPELLWKFFKDNAVEITQRYALTKKSTVHSKPFWTNELSLLAKEMKQCNKHYQYRNTDTNYLKLKDAIFKFNEARKEACKQFLFKQAQSLNHHKADEFWKNFNRIFNANKGSSIGVEPLKSADGNDTHWKEEEIENELWTTFFTGKYLKDKRKFDENFHQELHRTYLNILASFQVNSSFPVVQPSLVNLNSSISVAEIVKAIFVQKSDITKAFDCDNLHPIMLKKLGPAAIKVLTLLYNMCLTKYKWPWVSSNVIFLRKEGKDDYTNPSSYRPITISSCVGKLLEKNNE